jgi:hypothetical protein
MSIHDHFGVDAARTDYLLPAKRLALDLRGLGQKGW